MQAIPVNTLNADFLVVFLAQLLLVISVLGADVLLNTAFLAIPYNIIAHQFPAYGLIIKDGQEVVHPYVSSGLLLVAVTTLILFFASGMYSEKVAYANQYVNQSLLSHVRTLRS